MLWNQHSRLAGAHAFLSPSSYHWINYTEEKLQATYLKSLAARRGSELHALAHQLIKQRVRLPDVPKTLNMYVNDAIGYRMRPEQTLYFSDNCFGTADVCGFSQDVLHIFDLKTGEIDGSVHQLEVYAALFCLEYHFKPFEIEFDLRIYQKDDVAIFETDRDAVAHIMDRIKTFDKYITQMRLEALE